MLNKYMIRSKSLPIMSNLLNNCKPNISFNDFSNLNLNSDQRFISFGTYVSKYKNTTKSKRQKVIGYFYKNLLN